MSNNNDELHRASSWRFRWGAGKKVQDHTDDGSPEVDESELAVSSQDELKTLNMQATDSNSDLRNHVAVYDDSTEMSRSSVVDENKTSTSSTLAQSWIENAAEESALSVDIPSPSKGTRSLAPSPLLEMHPNTPLASSNMTENNESDTSVREGGGRPHQDGEAPFFEENPPTEKPSTVFNPKETLLMKVSEPVAMKNQAHQRLQDPLRRVFSAAPLPSHN